MKIQLNGEATLLDDGATVATLLERLGLQGPGVAVAINLDVVPPESYPQRVLREGDRVDIVTAVGGG